MGDGGDRGGGAWIPRTKAYNAPRRPREIKASGCPTTLFLPSPLVFKKLIKKLFFLKKGLLPIIWTSKHLIACLKMFQQNPGLFQKMLD